MPVLPLSGLPNSPHKLLARPFDLIFNLLHLSDLPFNFSQQLLILPLLMNLFLIVLFSVVLDHLVQSSLVVLQDLILLLEDVVAVMDHVQTRLIYIAIILLLLILSRSSISFCSARLDSSSSPELLTPVCLIPFSSRSILLAAFPDRYFFCCCLSL
jgi:hypothetical protein